MYCEDNMVFDWEIFGEDPMFTFSPAESLINFEVPSMNIESDNILKSDIILDSVTTIANLDEENANLSELFDFADLDKTIDLDHYLFDGIEATPSSGSESNDSEDSSPSMSVLGIDLDTAIVNQADEQENPKPVAKYTEPTYCKEFGAFQCPVDDCGRLYAKASHVRAHLRRHNGEKPFRCTWGNCQWRFARSDELSRHRRSHSGVKPYKCQQCEKRFTRSDHLAKHGRVHARKAAVAAAIAAQSMKHSIRTRRFCV